MTSSRFLHVHLRVFWLDIVYDLFTLVILYECSYNALENSLDSSLFPYL